MITPRLSRRLLRHHLPIGVASAFLIVALYTTRSYPDVLTRLSFATAYPALALLAITLSIGPWKVLRGHPLASSIDLRRDFGIWAGIIGFTHAAAGQFVHLRGRPWLYYIYENWQLKHVQPFRHDIFGLANDTGLVATLVLLLLLATSNDYSLRKFRAPGWKRLQRWSYVCFGLTAVHTFAYQVGIKSINLPYVIAAVVAVATTVTMQIIAYRRRRASVI